MLLPSKAVKYKESDIAKFIPILQILSNKEMEIKELYRKQKKNCTSIDEFVRILDELYALGKIEYDRMRGVISYVD